MEKPNVTLSMTRDPQFWNYSKFNVQMHDSKETYTISGFYDGDMCDDLRQLIAKKTKDGEIQIEDNWSAEQIHRWKDSWNEMVAHYSPY